MRSKLLFTIVFLTIFGLFANASAGFVNYYELARFLDETGASEEAPLEGVFGSQATSGNLKFSTGAKSTSIKTVDRSTLIDGNELMLWGYEDLDIGLSKAATSFGFQIVEPEKGASFVDSEFTVNIYSLNEKIGSFGFNAPNDIAFFVGFQTDELFDRVEIIELAGDADNEYFGQFYASWVEDAGSNGQPIPNPEPGTLVLMGCGALGIIALRMKAGKK